MRRIDGLEIPIGILHDFPAPDGGADFEHHVRLGMAAVADDGRLPGAVEFVHRFAMGLPLPGGSAHSVEQAFRALVDEGVVAVIGPAITDNTLVVVPLADRAGVPCINYAGAEAGRSEHMFHFQLGSLEDEPAFLARHLANRGFDRVAVVQDRSFIGRRLAEFFEDVCAVEHVRIAGRVTTSTIDTGTVAAELAPEIAGGYDAVAPDAVVSLGLWDVAHGLQQALAAEHWEVPVVAGSALIYGYHDAVWARDWESWTYIDTVSDDNPLFARLRAGAAPAPFGPGQAAAFDIGHLLAEGLARTRILDRRGVLEGIERVKSLASATGAAGTLMGFGRQDRAALKGQFLVVRQWQHGQSVEWKDTAG